MMKMRENEEGLSRVVPNLVEGAILELKVHQENSGDTENAHGQADKVLCKLLYGLGFADVVREWEKVPRWYA